ncbi:alpha/beta hydrolase [Pseudomonas sp. FW300-N2F2]|nr:alpha/beta hydrolase [Pseudomonas sp. FW300-N2F2]
MVMPERLGHHGPALVDDVAGLPPTFMAVGSLDLFLEEDVAYAPRLS